MRCFRNATGGAQVHSRVAGRRHRRPCAGASALRRFMMWVLSVQLTVLHWARQLAHGCLVKSIGGWRTPQQGSSRGEVRASERARENEREIDG